MIYLNRITQSKNQGAAPTTALPLTGICCSSDSIEIGFNFMFRSVADVPATDDDGEDALKDAGWGAVTSALQCMRQWFRRRLLSCM